jgi:hypothetical protein
MRVALFGLNMLVLATAVVSAVMAFDLAASAHALDPLWRRIFFALLGSGVFACMAAAAALTKRRRPDPAAAVRLLSFGGLLFTGAIAWSVALFFAV